MLLLISVGRRLYYQWPMRTPSTNAYHYHQANRRESKSPTNSPILKWLTDLIEYVGRKHLTINHYRLGFARKSAGHSPAQTGYNLAWHTYSIHPERPEKLIKWHQLHGQAFHHEHPKYLPSTTSNKRSASYVIGWSARWYIEPEESSIYSTINPLWRARNDTNEVDRCWESW